jgi:hypothetical protein
MPLFGQSGIGDVPEFFLFLLFCIWPWHIHCALTGNIALELVGFGKTAVSIQTAALILVVLAIPLIIRLKRKKVSTKIAIILLLYAATVLGTNLLPGLF